MNNFKATIFDIRSLISELNDFTVPEQMLFEDFKAGHLGSHLGYWNETNLAIQNLHVIPMPPTKFGLNQICGSGADMV